METLTLGIDVGYSHTKTMSKKGMDIFRSTVKDGIIDINTGSTVLEYDGNKLTIGREGESQLCLTRFQIRTLNLYC